MAFQGGDGALPRLAAHGHASRPSIGPPALPPKQPCWGTWLSPEGFCLVGRRLYTGRAHEGQKVSKRRELSVAMACARAMYVCPMLGCVRACVRACVRPRNSSGKRVGIFGRLDPGGCYAACLCRRVVRRSPTERRRWAWEVMHRGPRVGRPPPPLSVSYYGVGTMAFSYPSILYLYFGRRCR
ncbi:hypothetical protein BS50DRAFT_268667 [Corynespora cassiicola Philippines]|uniref:Uncharacterized protein n=1 Tax=Corynespora cassiicola Philippines TaxID=1448308 RepID=A0A2T2NZH6_CORCC|nr:hypothetical protein BS50DRAFT_268667 [Corynespora cassiicola Philippines]